MRRAAFPALVLFALLAACGQGDDARGDGAPNGAILPDEAEANVARAANESAAPGQEALPPLSNVPLDELAGVKVGMTIADLRARGFDVTEDRGPDPDNACGYARIKGLEDLFFMLDGKSVARIDVATPGHPTLGGVAVGMSEAEALRRLGDRVTVQPHPYTAPKGHYLVVHADKAPFGLIAETDGKSVLTYRIGRWAQVQWKEGCL
jgi:hypothetical protein